MTINIWVYIVGSLLATIVYGAIFRKAGYSGWLGLLMPIPVLNVCVLLWFASAHWPLERAAVRKKYIGQEDDREADAEWELKKNLRKALTLEKRGQYAEAIKQYELVAEVAGEDHPSATMARERVKQLRAKVSDSEAEPGAAPDPAT